MLTSIPKLFLIWWKSFLLSENQNAIISTINCVYMCQKTVTSERVEQDNAAPWLSYEKCQLEVSWMIHNSDRYSNNQNCKQWNQKYYHHSYNIIHFYLFVGNPSKNNLSITFGIIPEVVVFGSQSSMIHNLKIDKFETAKTNRWYQKIRIRNKRKD